MIFRRVPSLTICLLLSLAAHAGAQSSRDGLDSLGRALDCQSSDPLPTAKVLEPCYDSPPVAVNWGRMMSLRDRLYTDSLRDLGIGGRAVASVFVDRQGRAHLACIASSSGFDRLDNIVLAMMAVARYRPAMKNGEPVPTWHSTLVAFPFRMLHPPEGLPAADRVRPLPPCPRVSQESR